MGQVYWSITAFDWHYNVVNGNFVNDKSDATALSLASETNFIQYWLDHREISQLDHRENKVYSLVIS